MQIAQMGKPKSHRSAQHFAYGSIAIGALGLHENPTRYPHLFVMAGGRRGATKWRVMHKLGRIAQTLRYETAVSFAEVINRAFAEGAIVTVANAADRLRAAGLRLLKEQNYSRRE